MAGTVNLSFQPLTALQQAPIDVPLFDAPYSVPDATGWGFSRSSPWPFFCDGMNVSQGPGSSPSKRATITYKKTGVLTPFSLATFTGGNIGVGTTVPSINRYSTFHGNLSFDLSAFQSASVNIPGSSSLLIPAGASISGGSLNDWNFWSSASADYASPSFVEGQDPLLMWIYNSALGGPSGYALCAGFPTLDTLPVLGLTRNYFVVSLNEQFLLPFAYSGAVKPYKNFNVPGWYAGGAINMAQFNYVCMMGFFDVQAANWTVETTGINFNGTRLHMIPINYEGLQTTGYNFLFDLAGLQTMINGGAANFICQNSRFGMTLSWQTSTFSLIPGQGSQTIFVTGKFDPGGNQRPPAFSELKWAPIRWRPQTANANAAIQSTGIPDVKIDPNGVVHFHPKGAGATLTYVANSQGLDITIPGVSVDMSKANLNMALPSFCPCSPIAIPIAGA